MCKLINEAALEQDSHALGWLLNIQNKGQEALGRNSDLQHNALWFAS